MKQRRLPVDAVFAVVCSSLQLPVELLKHNEKKNELVCGYRFLKTGGLNKMQQI